MGRSHHVEAVEIYLNGRLGINVFLGRFYLVFHF